MAHVGNELEDNVKIPNISSFANGFGIEGTEFGIHQARSQVPDRHLTLPCPTKPEQAHSTVRLLSVFATGQLRALAEGGRWVAENGEL